MAPKKNPESKSVAKPRKKSVKTTATVPDVSDGGEANVSQTTAAPTAEPLSSKVTVDATKDATVPMDVDEKPTAGSSSKKKGKVKAEAGRKGQQKTGEVSNSLNRK